MGVSSPAVVDIVRTLSTDKPPAGTGSATGGLAQAILQERLQQQQQSQVRRLACLCALDLCNASAVGDVGGEGEYVADRGFGRVTPPTRVVLVNQIEATFLTFLTLG